MSEGRIIEHKGLGFYRVAVVRNNGTITAQISALESQINELNEALSSETDERLRGVILLKLTSARKQIVILQEATSDRETVAWCADNTPELSGVVGLVDVCDDPSGVKQIHPGAHGYNPERDGSIYPAIAMSPATTYFNQALVPAVQRWRPRYRHGKVVGYNEETDTFEVDLAHSYSSQQGLVPRGEETVETSLAATVTRPQGFSINPTNNSNNLIDYDEIWTLMPAWERFKLFYSGNPIATNKTQGSILTLTPELEAQLLQVNTEVNARITYKHDNPTQYGSRVLADDWNIISGAGFGDCEDFALTKMDALISLGWSASDLYLTACGVETENGAIGHMVVTIDTTDGTILMDLGNDEIFKVGDSKFYHYAWLSRMSGGKWLNVGSGITLHNVPADYLDCNSTAFVPGDWTLLRFGGSWATPSIIGYRFFPRVCPFIIINNFDPLDPDINAEITIVSPNGDEIRSLNGGQSTILDSGCSLHYDLDNPERELVWIVCSKNPANEGYWAFKDDVRYIAYDSEGNAIDDIVLPPMLSISGGGFGPL